MSVKSEKLLEGLTPTEISPLSSASSVICRICHEGDGCENLLAPCKCTGTVALIHRTCLEHWLTSSNSGQCEICKHMFKVTREPRSCRDYINDPSNQFNVRNLIADIVCFFLLTPLLVISTYLCSLGANQYFIKERWEAIGLVVLSLFLLAVYLTWCHVTIKYHLKAWTEWQTLNQQVRLIELQEEGRSQQNVIVCQNHQRISLESVISGEENNHCETSRIIT